MERRADEDGVGAGELGCGRLRACVDSAFRDDDPVPRCLRHERELGLAVDAERAEVACVDTDHAGAEAGRSLELFAAVLDKRVEASFLGRAHQLARSPVVEVTQDEQRRVGARVPRLAQMRVGREEPLREQGQLRRRARRAQVVDGAGERVVDEDGDGPRASGLVRRDDDLDPRASGRCRRPTASAA